MESSIFPVNISLRKYIDLVFFTLLCNLHSCYILYKQFKFTFRTNKHSKILFYFILFTKKKNSLNKTFINKFTFFKLYSLDFFNAKEIFSFFFLNYIADYKLYFKKKTAIELFGYIYNSCWIFNFNKKIKNSNTSSKNFKASYFRFFRNCFFIKSNEKNFQLNTKKNLSNEITFVFSPKQACIRSPYVIFSPECIDFFLSKLNVFFGVILKLFFLFSYSFKTSFNIIILYIKNLFFFKKKKSDITTTLLYTFFFYKKEFGIDKFFYNNMCIVFFLFFSKHFFYSEKFYSCFSASVDFFLNSIYNTTDKTTYIIDNILVYTRLLEFLRKKKRTFDCAKCQSDVFFIYIGRKNLIFKRKHMKLLFFTDVFYRSYTYKTVNIWYELLFYIKKKKKFLKTILKISIKMLKNFFVSFYSNFKDFVKKSARFFVSRRSVFFVLFELVNVFKIYNFQSKKNSKNKRILSKKNQITVKIGLIQEILPYLNAKHTNYNLYVLRLNKCALIAPNRNYFLTKTLKHLTIDICSKKHNNITKDMLNENYFKNFPKNAYICIEKIFNFKINNKNFSFLKYFYFKSSYLNYKNFFLTTYYFSSIQQTFLENNLIFNRYLIQLIFLFHLTDLDNFFKKKSLKRLSICLQAFFMKFDLNFYKNLKLLNKNNEQNFLIKENRTNKKFYIIKKKFEFFFKLFLFYQTKTVNYAYTVLKAFFLSTLLETIPNVQFSLLFVLFLYRFLRILNKIKYITKKIKKIWFKKVLFIKCIQLEMINTISVYQKFHTWLIVLKIVSILKMIYMKREKSVFKVKYFENILDRSEFSIINKTNNNYLQLKLI